MTNYADRLCYTCPRRGDGMIEVIYKEEKTVAEEEMSSFSVPRNIRQVGLIGESFRIYMEDYVYTFLKRLSEKRGAEERNGRLAILKGETRWKNEITYLFVRGAVLAPMEHLTAESLALSEEDWGKIQEEEKRYFPLTETVGWYYTEPGLRLQMNHTFDSLHLKYFGADKVCMLMDPLEKEEAFFRYENNNLIRQSGYYLFYEKNPEMQAYMIEKKQELSNLPRENTEDQAVKSFRQKISENEEEVTERKSIPFYNGFLNYAATACLAITVLTAGFHFYQNYRKIEEQNGMNLSAKSVSSETALETSARSEISSEVETQNEFEKKKKNEKEEKSENESNETGKNSGMNEETEEDLMIDQEMADGHTENTGEYLKVIEKAEKDPVEVIDPEGKVGKESEKSSDTAEEDRKEAETSNDTAEIVGKESEKSMDTASVPMHESYVIRPGDTLFQICLDHYGSLDRLTKLCKLNGISENDVIYPGEIIVLP